MARCALLVAALALAVPAQARELPNWTWPAGDVNGDGFADVAVATDPGSGGIVQVFVGSSSGLDTVPAASLRPQPCHESDLYGYAIAAGDFDADGFGDLAVAAIGYEEDRGRVYVFRGQASGVVETPTALTAPDATPNAYLGWALHAADVDGDGYDDLTVGAPHVAHSDPTRPGTVYTWFGGPAAIHDDDAPAQLQPNGIEYEARFGSDLVVLDVDADGVMDLVASARSETNVGRLYTYGGGPTGFVDASEAVVPAARVGTVTSLVDAGDVDGDGYRDVLVSDWGEDSVWLHRGSATGLQGSPTRLFAADGPWGDGDPYVYFAYGISVSAGDLNGDGFPDVAVGATGDDPAYSYFDEPGAAYVHLGGPTGIATRSTTRITSCDGRAPGDDDFGSKVAIVGDIDADGYDDLVISGPDGPAILMGRATWPDELCAEPWTPEHPEACCDDGSEVSPCGPPCEDTGVVPTTPTDTGTTPGTTPTTEPDDANPPDGPAANRRRECVCASGTAPGSLAGLVVLALIGGVRRRAPRAGRHV